MRMTSILEKIGIRGDFKKNFGAIVLLALAGSAIFGLPFFRFEYYDAYLATYHLTNTQMGVFGTIIGVFGIVSYLFGGVVADGMSIRKVISVSLLATGIAGLFHLLPLNFNGLLVIYAVWGVSTTFAFQPACVKAVRVMAGKDNQGKAYGFFEGTQSVAGAIVAMVALAIFNWGASQAGNEVAAMKYAILFYSITNIVMGVLSYCLVRDDNARLRAGKVSFKGIAQVVKSPVIWIICLIGFCNHVLCLSVYYYIPYVTDALGAAVAFGALLGIFRKWGGFIGDIGGGYLADRVGTGRLMLASYAIVLGAQIVMLLVPAVPSSVAFVAILFVVIYTFFSVNMAMSWTMMSEGAIPVEYSGTAAGLICMVGAIPETFVSVLAGRMIDTNPGVGGFHSFFYFLAGVTAVGLVLLIVYNRYLSRRGASEACAAKPAEGAACRSCHGGVNAIDDAAPRECERGNASAGEEAAESDPSHCRESAELDARARTSCQCKLNVIDDPQEDDGDDGNRENRESRQPCGKE